MEMNYKNIKKMLDGDVYGAAIGEDGEKIILQWDKVKDCREDDENYSGPLCDPEEVYTASWISKRVEHGNWWVTHVYHEDGTVEEMFEFEEVPQ